MVNLLLVSVIISVPYSITPLNPHPKLLLISMDGFRYDLITPEYVPNIHQWATEGTWFTSGSRVQYVSFTATNHMGIVTGLHAESHGIVSNVFYEHDHGSNTFKQFDYWNISGTAVDIKQSHEHSWYRGEPVWVTNEKAHPSRHSACLQWPMCDANFRNANKPTYYTTWTKPQKYDEWITDIDTIIKLFTRINDPVNFIAWYIDEPDTTLHKHGFHDGKLLITLAELDKVFSSLLDEMKRRDLIDKVNIILTADHGHAEIESAKTVLCVPDYVDMARIKWGQNMIYTGDEAVAREVYHNLTRAKQQTGLKVKIYTKASFPGHHHYKRIPSRIGEVILEPEIGYEVDFKCTQEEFDRKYDHGRKKYNKSTHGHDPSNPELHAILVLSGPDIGDAHKAGRAAHITDLYPLMCYLLNVQPAPNNGSLHRIAMNFHLKNYSYEYFNAMYIVALPLFVIIALVILCFIVRCMMYQKASQKTENEYVIEEDYSSSPV